MDFHGFSGMVKHFQEVFLGQTPWVDSTFFSTSGAAPVESRPRVALLKG